MRPGVSTAMCRGSLHLPQSSSASRFNAAQAGFFELSQSGMARRDAAGVRLLTRNGHDWSSRFPLIVAAVAALKVRSCLIDGKAGGDSIFRKSGLATVHMHRRCQEKVILR